MTRTGLSLTIMFGRMSGLHGLTSKTSYRGIIKAVLRWRLRHQERTETETRGQITVFADIFSIARCLRHGSEQI